MWLPGRIRADRREEQTLADGAEYNLCAVKPTAQVGKERRGEPDSEDALARWLAAFLPPDGAPVTVLGPRALAVALEERCDSPISSIAAIQAEATAAWQTVLICGEEAVSAVQDAEIKALHAALREGGRLIAVRPARDREEHTWRDWVSRLSALGFTILAIRPRGRMRDRDEIPAGPEDAAVLIARRDRYRIRSYEDGDEAAILDLFGPSFHTTRGEAAWSWKYRQSPYGNLRISMAFDPEGSLVAHYAGYPVPFFSPQDGCSYIGMQIGDIMTRRSARAVGRGPTSLLARTARHYYASFCEEKVAFNYGFVTANHRTFSRRFVGAEILEPAPYRVLQELEDLRRDQSSRLRVERIEACSPAFDRFFRRVAPRYGFLVARDARYLSWRYLSRPDATYCFLAAYRLGRLVGWGVFRRLERRLVWGDALFLPGHAAAATGALLAAALAAPEHGDIDHIAAWFPPRPLWWHRLLLALGFQARPQPDDLAFMFVPHQMTEARERLAGLYYTMGDGDLF